MDYLLHGFFPAAIDIASRTHAHRRYYDVIVSLLFSRILINYEKNENKTSSKIYTITVSNFFMDIWRMELSFSNINFVCYLFIKALDENVRV